MIPTGKTFAEKAAVARGEQAEWDARRHEAALTDLIAAAKAVLPIFDAFRYTAGLGKNQEARIAALISAIGRASE